MSKDGCNNQKSSEHTAAVAAVNRVSLPALAGGPLPLVHSTLDVPEIMWGTALALTPVLFCAVFFFGTKACLLYAVCCGAAVFSEMIVGALCRGKPSLHDGSAFLIGLLIALSLPPTVTLPVAALGAGLAVLLGKLAWGGLGGSILNPVLLGRLLIQLAFPEEIGRLPLLAGSNSISNPSALSPLNYAQFSRPAMELLWGNLNGCLAEASTGILMVSAILICSAGYCKWRIPLGAILTAAVFSTVLWTLDTEMYLHPLDQILGGGFLFGVFFLASDAVTSPITSRGMWLFGAGVAVIAVAIGLFYPTAEGVMYAILPMNLLVPFLDRRK